MSRELSFKNNLPNRRILFAVLAVAILLTPTLGVLPIAYAAVSISYSGDNMSLYSATETSSNHWDLVMKWDQNGYPEYLHPESRGYFRFQVSGASGTHLYFTMYNTGDDLFVDFADTTGDYYYPWYSNDGGETWTAITTGVYHSGTSTYTFDFTPSSNSVQVAKIPAWTYTQMTNWMSGLNTDHSGLITVEDLVTTSDGIRKVKLLTVTDESVSIDDKLKVWIQAGQHASEFGGMLTAKATIDYLTGETTEANRLLKRYVYYIVPMINPTGVYLGNTRLDNDTYYNTVGHSPDYTPHYDKIDLNRRWQYGATDENTQAVYDKLDELFADGVELEAFIDLHDENPHNQYVSELSSTWCSTYGYDYTESHDIESVLDNVYVGASTSSPTSGSNGANGGVAWYYKSTYKFPTYLCEHYHSDASVSHWTTAGEDIISGLNTAIMGYQDYDATDWMNLWADLDAATDARNLRNSTEITLQPLFTQEDVNWYYNTGTTTWVSDAYLSPNVIGARPTVNKNPVEVVIDYGRLAYFKSLQTTAEVVIDSATLSFVMQNKDGTGAWSASAGVGNHFDIQSMEDAVNSLSRSGFETSKTVIAHTDWDIPNVASWSGPTWTNVDITSTIQATFDDASWNGVLLLHLTPNTAYTAGTDRSWDFKDWTSDSTMSPKLHIHYHIVDDAIVATRDDVRGDYPGTPTAQQWGDCWVDFRDATYDRNLKGSTSITLQPLMTLEDVNWYYDGSTWVSDAYLSPNVIGARPTVSKNPVEVALSYGRVGQLMPTQANARVVIDTATLTFKMVNKDGTGAWSASAGTGNHFDVQSMEDATNVVTRTGYETGKTVIAHTDWDIPNVASYADTSVDVTSTLQSTFDDANWNGVLILHLTPNTSYTAGTDRSWNFKDYSTDSTMAPKLSITYHIEDPKIWSLMDYIRTAFGWWIPV